MTVVAVIQARLGSTRLPGKVAFPLGDKRVLHHVIEHALDAKLVDHVVVATSFKRRDDLVASLARDAGAAVERGSEDDVLARFCNAASSFDTTTVIRLTADNPFVTGSLIDAVVANYRSASCIYAANTLNRELPVGLKAEAVDFETLQSIERETDAPDHREHVTKPILENPKRYSLSNVSIVDLVQEHELGEHLDIRLTLDRPSDYENMQRVVRDFDDSITIPGILKRIDELELSD